MNRHAPEHQPTRPVQYIFANRGAKQTPGKLAAQVAHAAILSFVDSDFELKQEWLDSCFYTKLVMLAEDEAHMYAIDRYLLDRGYKTFMVIDEGLTEVRAHTPTALGVELVDKDDLRVQQHFGHFKLYKELPPRPVETPPLETYRDSGEVPPVFWEKVDEVVPKRWRQR